MIVLGVVFRCLDAMMILGAAGTERSLLVRPLGKKRESNDARRRFSQNSGSDHIAFLNAYRSMRDTATHKGYEAARQFGQEWFIHDGAFKSIETATHEIENILVTAGLIPYTSPANRQNNQLGDPSLNETSSNIALIKALLTAGFPSNIATVTSPHQLRTKSGDLPTFIHPSSIKGLNKKGVNSGTRGEDSKLNRRDLFTYSTMTKSIDGKHLFLRDVSQISPLTAALFGGHLRKKPDTRPNGNILELNKWLPLSAKGAYNAPRTLLEYRQALDQLLSSTFQDLFRRPKEYQKELAEGEEVMERQYLADDPLRAFFVDGVVDLLDRDAARTREEAEASRADADITARMFSNRSEYRPGQQIQQHETSTVVDPLYGAGGTTW
jgi:ATP-dependent RNA helicase DHX36